MFSLEISGFVSSYLYVVGPTLFSISLYRKNIGLLVGITAHQSTLFIANYPSNQLL
jgi:hypothetical protein